MLLNVLSFGVESDGDDACEAIKKLVKSDSSDSLMKHEDGIHTFFNAFLIAYFSLKGSPEESAFVSFRKNLKFFF